MGYKTVLVEQRSKVAKVIMNRPDKKNAMNPQLVMDMAQVLEDLRYVLPSREAAPAAGEPPEGESALLAALGHDPVGLDALIARTGIPAPLLQAQLLELELAGLVARLPGGLFQRQANA